MHSKCCEGALKSMAQQNRGFVLQGSGEYRKIGGTELQKKVDNQAEESEFIFQSTVSY